MAKKPETPQKTFREVLEHFDNAMLVTRSSDGLMRARPMAIARSEGDGDLWFFSSIESRGAFDFALSIDIPSAMQMYHGIDALKINRGKMSGHCSSET